MRSRQTHDDHKHSRIDLLVVVLILLVEELARVYILNGEVVLMDDRSAIDSYCVFLCHIVYLVDCLDKGIQPLASSLRIGLRLQILLVHTVFNLQFVILWPCVHNAVRFVESHGWVEYNDLCRSTIFLMLRLAALASLDSFLLCPLRHWMLAFGLNAELARATLASSLFG